MWQIREQASVPSIATALKARGWGGVALMLALVGAGGCSALRPEPLEPAGAEAEVEVRVTMNLLRDAPALFGALSAGAVAEGLDYRLTGYVDVKRRGPDRLPLSAAGKLGPLSAQPGATPPAGRS